MHSIVVLNWGWIHLIDQVILIGIFDGQLSRTATLMVHPAELRPHSRRRSGQVDSLLRLGVHKSVPKEQLLAFQVLVLLRQVIPTYGHWSEISS